MAVVWLLLWVPVLWLVAATAIHFPAWVTGRGVDVEGAVQRAARAAAYQITSESYADANPRIDPAKALAEARAYLAENLRLDPDTLAPEPGSWFAAAPTIHVAVANGPFPQELEIPGYPQTRVTFPTAGVIVLVDGVLRTPVPAEEHVTVWAAARVYRRGGP